MTGYTIKYGRKVQVKPYEMLTIELTQDFETSLTGHEEGFNYVQRTVDRWIELRKVELGAP